MISWTRLLTEPLKLEEEARLKQKPRVVVWNITSRCNLSCRHCYFNAAGTQSQNELTLKEAKDLIADLADLGVATLLFSGGEPLLRKDIFELAKFATDKGIKTALSTNGTLISEAVSERIREAGFTYVGISLDGLAQINDAFRKAKGAFKASILGIKNCQGQGLKVGLRFTLTKYNLPDLPRIFELVERESIPRLCLYHLVYAGRGNNLKEQDLNNPEKRQVLDFIWEKVFSFHKRGLNTKIFTVDNHADGAWLYLKLKKKDALHAKVVLEFLKLQGGNSSGVNLAAVDNYGNVYPDQFWRTYRLGNIRLQRFSDIWQDEQNTSLQDLRNRRPLLKGRCQRCNFLSICNGNFRARAESVFGQPWADDPACYLTQEEISQDAFISN